MQTLLASRIELTPRPHQNNIPVLACGMAGHCPGRVRKERLFALPEAISAIRSAGFDSRLAELEKADEAIFHLPIPINSSAEFHDIFPDAATATTNYRSTLAGSNAWLPGCVDDFFANGGTRLWVVAVPEDEDHNAFLPDPGVALHNTGSLRGIASLLVIPEVGLIVLPDLERLQIPAKLPGVPAPVHTSESVHFVPCSTSLPVSESSFQPSSPQLSEPLETEVLLKSLLPLLNQHRPDIQWLWPVSLFYDQDRQIPAVSDKALNKIRNIANSPSGHRLRQLQFVFPYLARANGQLSSPSGVLAGAQSRVAQTQGPWRSIAGQVLVTSGEPFPLQSIPSQTALRNNPGISVLTRKPQGVMLDDERLAVPALHPDDYSYFQQQDRYDSFRSAEIMRFLGHLRRQLKQLGERLVFRADHRDSAPRLALENFLRQLHRQGALRGGLPEEAFYIEQTQSQEGVILIEVILAPSLPIDRIRLTFTNRFGEWQGELKND
ncbi:hypothetical protein [Marinobacter sp.]|uniref:hypothetical protein n=1 Tax=Marinobacter sp. TaxID=50741 RepID=UPI003A9259A8